MSTGGRETRTYSHSIISEPLKRVFRRVFSASRRSDTVRHTVETDRWRAIERDRSRQPPKHVLSYSLFSSSEGVHCQRRLKTAHSWRSIAHFTAERRAALSSSGGGLLGGARGELCQRSACSRVR